MNIIFLCVWVQDNNISWCVSNGESLVSDLFVQRETPHALDGVVETKFEVANILIPVLGSDTSIFLQDCLVILSFWFLREYVLGQDFLAGDCLNTGTRRRQLIRRKNFQTGG